MRPRLLRRIPLLIGALVLASALMSCSPKQAGTTAGGPSATKPRVMIITNGLSPFWDPMEVGLRKAAQEVGVDASWDGPKNSTIAEQKSLVERYSSQGYQGIAISSIEAAPMVPVIDGLVSRGIKVITLDSDTPGSKRFAYIGTNNFRAGQEAGRAAVRLLPTGGTFVAFVGNQSAQNARERIDGFKDAVKGHNITVTDVMDDQKDPIQARRNVENVIQSRGGKVTGLLGVYSYNGPAIAEAVSTVKARGRYKIVVFDAEPKTLQELETGSIDAAIVQKPYEFGYQSVKLLAALIRDGEQKARQELKVPADGIIDTGVEVVTPATVKDFRARLRALGVKSS